MKRILLLLIIMVFAAACSETSSDSGGYRTVGILVEKSSVNFGDVKLGGVSAPEYIHITNGNLIPVNFTLTGLTHFDVDASDCAQPFPANGACMVSVTPKTATAGKKTEVLSITQEGFTSIDVTLTANVIKFVPVAEFNMGVLDFGNIPVNQESDQLVLRIANKGQEPMTVTIPAPTKFSIKENGCLQAIGEGNHCFVSFVTTPSDLNKYDEKITITTNAPNIPSYLLTLSATPVDSLSAIAKVTGPYGYEVDRVELSDTPINVQSQEYYVTLENAGNAQLTFSYSKTGDAYIVDTSDCGTSLILSSTCVIAFSKKSATADVSAGTFKITTNSTGISEFNIALSGRVVANYFAEHVSEPTEHVELVSINDTLYAVDEAMGVWKYSSDKWVKIRPVSQTNPDYVKGREYSVAAVSGIIYVANKDGVIWSFDVATSKWMPLTMDDIFMPMVAVGTNLYFPNSIANNGKLMHYNTVDDLMYSYNVPEVGTPLPFLKGASATAIGNKMYLFGGYNNSIDKSDRFIELNLTDRSFREITGETGARPAAAYSTVSMSLDGKVYLLSSSETGQKISTYDPAKNMWARADNEALFPNMSIEYNAMAAIGSDIYLSGRIFSKLNIASNTATILSKQYTLPLTPDYIQSFDKVVVGGKLYTFSDYGDSMYWYDSSAKSWAREAVPAGAKPAIGASQFASGMVAHNGTIYLEGSNTLEREFWSFNMASKVWTKRGGTRMPKVSSSDIIEGYSIGGKLYFNSLRNGWYECDPAMGNFTELVTANVAFSEGIIKTVPIGNKIYGFRAGGAQVLVYDIASKTMETPVVMPSERPEIFQNGRDNFNLFTVKDDKLYITRSSAPENDLIWQYNSKTNVWTKYDSSYQKPDSFSSLYTVGSQIWMFPTTGKAYSIVE